MKKILAILSVFTMIAASSAAVSAESVNLGLIEMDRADYVRLQGLVSGKLELASKAPVAKAPTRVNAGLIQLSAADLAAIRHYVDGKAAFNPSAGVVVAKNHINVGLIGDMDASDLQEIQRMVRERHNRKNGMLAGLPVALNK